MSNTIYHFHYIKENQLTLSQICSYWIYSKGLKNEFETTMVNKPSVFEPLKFYCTEYTGQLIRFWGQRRVLHLIVYWYDRCFSGAVGSHKK